MLTLKQVGNVAKTRYMNETGQLSRYHTLVLNADGVEIRRRTILRPVRGPKGKGKGLGGKATINFSLPESVNGQTLQSYLSYILLDGIEASEESNTIVFQYKYDYEVVGQGIQGWFSRLRARFSFIGY